MFIRIVKMEFRPDAVPEFMKVFEASSPQIRAFPGCMRLELLQDRLHPNILFTYSYWTSDEALNVYRHSALFESTWAQTKVLFNAKPEAWSVNRITELP